MSDAAGGFVRDEASGSHQHPAGQRGRLDESRWRLSHEELAVARMLVAEGHDVRSQAQRPGVGRIGDFEVCGRETEVKTLGPNATSRSLANALIRARGQGVDVIIDASRTRLHQMAVDRGVADFSQRRSAELDGPRRGPVLPEIERIRVLGRGFERSYRLDDARQIATARPVERRPSERSVGLGLGLA